MEAPRPGKRPEWLGPRPAADWGPGTRVAGRYTIEAQIGEGASAVTYRSRDEVLGRPVALKVLRSRFARDPEVVARFEREAKIAAAIAQHHVVAVYDYGTDGGAFFIALQYVAGRDLREELEERGRLPAEEAVGVGRAILAGLSAIHLAGIVHRDVKPSNVLIGADGVTRLTDFGVAHEIVADRLTSHGTTIGTAAYMAPEQARGGEVTPQTDLYAVGVVLFECLTGRLPFAHDNPMATLLAQIQTPPPRPSQVAPTAHIPASLEGVVLRAMAKDPGTRYASAAAMSQALAGAIGQAASPAATTRLPAAAGAAWSTPPTPTTRLPGPPVPPTQRGRFAPAAGGWSKAAGRGASGRVRPWLAAAGLALIALVVVAAVVLANLDGDGDGDGGGDGDDLPVVGFVPTATVSPTEPDADGLAPPDEPTATEAAPTATRTPTEEPEPTSTTEPTETVEPTEEPTEEPIEEPTRTPTVAPTEEPTAEPTAEPTDEPTATPPPTETPEPDPTPTAELVEDSPTGAGGSEPVEDGGTAFEASAWDGGTFEEDELGQPATVLRGRGSGNSRATLTFALSAVPSEGVLLRFGLFMPESGLGDGFLVVVNGATFGVSEGAPPVGWSTIELQIAVDQLVAGENVVEVTYEAPAGRAGQDAEIGLGGGEIVPLTSGGGAATGDSSTSTGGGVSSTGGGGSSSDVDETEGDETGPGSAPTIAPSSG